MSKYYKLYVEYLKLSVKNVVEYRTDFFIGILSMITEQVISIATLLIIFQNIPSIANWKLNELILMYAFSTLGRSIDITFFDNYWTFGWKYLRPGNFDRVLTKPINNLYQITAERIQVHGIGFFIIGLLALIYSFINLNIEFSITNMIMIVVFTFFSGLIYAGINMFLMTLSFWIIDALPLMTVTFSFAMIGRYPIELFPNFIKVVICVFLPYAFTGYYPATYFFIGEHYSSLSLLTPVVAMTVWIISYMFFNYGSSKYIGAGN